MAETRSKSKNDKAESTYRQSRRAEGPKGPDVKGELDFAIGSHRLGKQVIEAEDLSISFAGQTLVERFTDLVVPGDRIGFIGPNGVGKTTLLNCLAGKIEPTSGQLTIGQTVRIGYYTQDHKEMNDELTIIEYIKETAEIVKTSDGAIVTAEQMLERFLFPRSMQRTFIRKLSGENAVDCIY